MSTINLQRSAIKPITILGKTGSILYIDQYSGIPGQSVTINYGIVNTNWERIAGGSEMLSGDDYNNWGDTDDYLVTKLCERIKVEYIGPWEPQAAAPTIAVAAPLVSNATPAPDTTAATAPTTDTGTTTSPVTTATSTDTTATTATPAATDTTQPTTTNPSV